jgi:hypothetical protein
MARGTVQIPEQFLGVSFRNKTDLGDKKAILQLFKVVKWK